jgi:hypothetical protein
MKAEPFGPGLIDTSKADDRNLRGSPDWAAPRIPAGVMHFQVCDIKRA